MANSDPNSEFLSDPSWDIRSVNLSEQMLEHRSVAGWADPSVHRSERQWDPQMVSQWVYRSEHQSVGRKVLHSDIRLEPHSELNSARLRVASSVDQLACQIPTVNASASKSENPMDVQSVSESVFVMEP